ncbi:MAG TPA: DUF4956 domain-containing protein [Vicinamibacterales bacterium]|nr:DUF4956 domain-containing protein [Vicinamibacterales bacterium]
MIWLVLSSAAIASAQVPPQLTEEPARQETGRFEFEHLRQAALRLPLAAVLGAALAIRVRRRGTPPRSAAVVQTQIILSIIGALVMLIVGASLARAFGVVGVAGLVRYRAKIADPKDAGVMLATLGVGLAAGVGLYTLSIFSTLFFAGMLWLLESFEPEARKLFMLTVKSKEAARLVPLIEKLLRRHRAQFELRASAPDSLSYELRLPISQRTEPLSRAIADLDSESTFEWEEKKEKAPALP